MRDSFLVFGRPHIGEEEIAEVVDCLRGGWIGSGPRVRAFEKAFAAYKGVEDAAAVSSCTAALHLALLAEGIGPGDEVITTAMTFCATVNAILHAGATPVLVDCDRRTMNIDPERVAERIGPRTKAILPVHFAGRMCDMDALGELAQRHNLKIIEDCAHAVESTWKGRPAGTIGDAGCFSFYVTKNITTAEGGMILARSPEAMSRFKTLALHGLTHDAWKRFSDSGYKHYQVVECGFKYNMTDLQAAIGLHQLERVDALWRRRECIWNRYQAAFADLPVERPAPFDADSRHGLHLYAVRIEPEALRITRDELIEAMTRARIGVGVHYRAVPTHPYYAQTLGVRPEDFPHAFEIGERTMSLPLSSGLSDCDVDDVIEALSNILRSAKR